jgi:hypothetical protein
MYWVWASEPTSDAEALICGTSAKVERLDLEFDTGLPLSEAAPVLQISRTPPYRGPLTESVLLSGINALLFSSRLRAALAEIPLDNVQYWPVVLHNPGDGSKTADYHVVNIVGRVACLDREKSVLETDADDAERIEFIDVLAIDEKKAAGLDLFRLHEDPQFIIASDRVKQTCERHRITGVHFYQPADYPY